jgi:hypothetical protein
MSAEQELLEEINRLLTEERFDEADALVDQLEPVSAEEFNRRLSEAPVDDEPLTAEDRAVFDHAWKVIRDSIAEPSRRFA